ncbi:hypothetical protein ANCCAN_13514 [Ancylostoma caninum]|uniref:Uncharacterized protein n=1 Tax=Ancylostoma caninum TaxID=29170 RepID=A0A368G806_ANCCA|nr:hypothetical protein ANCCAN_13514 [Ancylostoma caninum]
MHFKSRYLTPSISETGKSAIARRPAEHPAGVRQRVGLNPCARVLETCDTGVAAADRSVDSAIGNGELDKDSLSRALCILIAKVDRFYSKVGHELNLRSLRELCIAMTSASENRIFYSGKKAPALTPATNLLTRISEVLSPLGNRPLVHQMLLWPTVCAHFVQVASCPDESSIGVTALSDAISSLILSESQGLCFNQMLIAPFQVS